ncbi:isochorismatase family protein [Cognatitamlana onchidii]|uniref:isochorismatase family protein n=1 Tax=Cognatitamlana onchidii TaxID=2562860 RepID=UPI00196AE26A|nr:isochorismatase family protein [Algibacter onchidii]
MAKKALLVIDMQKGSFTPKTPRYDTAGVVSRMNKLAHLFNRKGLPVIYIQHDGTRDNNFLPHTEAWELLDTLDVPGDAYRIDKYANDVFYKSKLKATLDSLNVDALVITGCATDFCVAATIQSAIAKDYDITVVANGHTTGDRPHLSAKQVIRHYNWVWQNMIPTKGEIKVKDFESIVASL